VRKQGNRPTREARQEAQATREFRRENQILKRQLTRLRKQLDQLAELQPDEAKEEAGEEQMAAMVEVVWCHDCRGLLKRIELPNTTIVGCPTCKTSRIEKKAK
jgi:hypothetical protein